MQTMTIFSIGIFLIATVSVVGWVWARHIPNAPADRRQDTWMLWFFLYLAAFCLLGYVALVFGR